ncbi:DNRLRE domain-containing protein [bacterium]|nr:DNRLRE domain-containing protein [bacterium]
MKIYKYIVMVIIILGYVGHGFAQVSERILKHYSSVSDADFDSSGIYTPFSSGLAMKSIVYKPIPQGGYYLIAFATDINEQCIFHTDLTGGLVEWSGEYGGPGDGDGQFLMPAGIAADQHGNVFVVDADSSTSRIVKLHYDFVLDSLTFVQNIYCNLMNPYAVAIDSNRTSNPADDRLWITDTGNHRIVELDFSGNLLRTIGTEGSGINQFSYPTAIKVFDHDANGVTWLSVGDAGNGRLVNMGTDGTWYEVPVYDNEAIVDIQIFDSEIYVLQHYTGFVQKIHWPDTYLCIQGDQGMDEYGDPVAYDFPNSMCIPYPESLPYIYIVEQISGTNGFQINVQGVDVTGISDVTNYNGSGTQVDWGLLTNSIIYERIVDANGNVIKTLTDGLTLDSAPGLATTWYGDASDGSQVVGGTYYHEVVAQAKWEFEDGGALGKSIWNTQYATNTSAEPVDVIVEKTRIDIPISIQVEPCADNTIVWDAQDTNVINQNKGNDSRLSFGTKKVSGSLTRQRILMKFDLLAAGLTARDKVTDASVMLRLYDYENGNWESLDLYRVLKGWEEGSSCWSRGWTDMEYWNGCAHNDNYSKENVTHSFSTEFQTGWYEWAGENICEMVQDWLCNPASNHGILIELGDDYRDEDHWFQFFSSEEADPDFRPRLEVVYEKDIYYPYTKAEITVDCKQGPPPLTIRFDGSNSYTPTGVETWNWDFCLTDTVAVDTTGRIVYHTFTEYGNHKVSLTTIDSASVSCQDTLIISVGSPELECVYQAENMPIKTGGTQDGTHWCLYSDAYVGDYLDIPVDGYYDFACRGRGIKAEGVWATCYIALDDVVMDTLAFNSWSTNIFNKTVYLNAGLHLLSVGHSNPLQATPHDRNLYIDWFSLKRVDVEPVLNIIYPAAGDTILANSAVQIRWQSDFMDDVVDLAFKKNGSAWTSIATNETDDGTFDWAVPDTTIDSCYVRVVAANTGMPADSIGPFAIFNGIIPIDLQLECEDMPVKSGGTGGDGLWQIPSGGYLAETVNFTGTSLYKFNLRGFGPYGTAQIALLIDDVPQCTLAVLSSDNYISVFNVTAGTHEVKIQSISGRMNADNLNISTILGIGFETQLQLQSEYLTYKSEGSKIGGYWHFPSYGSYATEYINFPATDIYQITIGGRSTNWVTPTNIKLYIDGVLANSITLTNGEASENITVQGGVHELKLVHSRAFYSDWVRISKTGLGKAIPGEIAELLPKKYALHQNYPNPFNPTTNIQFDLPEATDVKLIVYNMLGREIVRLIDNHMTAGYKHLVWDAKGRNGLTVPSGLYLIRIIAGDYVSVKKMMLVK